MKKIKLVLILGVSIAVVFFAAVFAPYVYYTKILYQGDDGSYFIIPGLNEAVRVGEEVQIAFNEEENLRLWKKFHFENFSIPFPVHHPQVLVIPIIKEYFPNQFLKFGALFANTEIEEYISFVIEKPITFDWADFEGKIFSLPIARKVINEKNISQVWHDLFVKELNVFSQKKKFSDVFSTSYRELIYNLFIQKLRTKYFPKESIKVSFIEDRKIGLIQRKSEDERYLLEDIFVLRHNIIYRISLKSSKWVGFAKDVRNRFLAKLSFKPDEETSAALIYSEYKSLAYTERIDQEGMTYLYCAWSHVTHSKDFLREMIQFLERGKNNIHHLNSLYQYGYKRFGTSFSLREERLKERASEKLERKMKEELEAEIQEERRKQAPVEEGHFESDEERVNFLLRKAKDSGKNSDDSDSMLIE